MLRALYTLFLNSCSQGAYHLVEEVKYGQSRLHAERVMWTEVLAESEKGPPVLLFSIRCGDSKCPGGLVHISCSLLTCYSVLPYYPWHVHPKRIGASLSCSKHPANCLLYPLLIPINSTFICFCTLRSSIEFLLRMAAATFKEKKNKKTSGLDGCVGPLWFVGSRTPTAHLLSASWLSKGDLKLAAKTNVDLQLKTEDFSCQQGCNPDHTVQDFSNLVGGCGSSPNHAAQGKRDQGTSSGT